MLLTCKRGLGRLIVTCIQLQGSNILASGGGGRWDAMLRDALMLAYKFPKLLPVLLLYMFGTFERQNQGWLPVGACTQLSIRVGVIPSYRSPSLPLFLADDRSFMVQGYGERMSIEGPKPRMISGSSRRSGYYYASSSAIMVA